jgi:hypothetical protein
LRPIKVSIGMVMHLDGVLIGVVDDEKSTAPFFINWEGITENVAIRLHFEIMSA